MSGGTAIPMGALPRYHAARKPPGAIALVHPEGELTWQGLEARANQRAHFYKTQGVKPGDFVVLALPNGNVFYEASFAIWKLGAIPALVSPKLPRGEATGIVELLQPALVIAPAGEWPEGVRRVSGAESIDAFDAASFPEAPPAPYWKAMTSGGSTGRPKIIVDHAPAAYDPSSVGFEMRIDDVLLNPGPLYHNGPFGMTHLALFSGATIVGMHRFDAEEALRLIERHRVAWVNFVPTMLNRIAALPEDVRARYDISSLRAVWHSAAPMPAWLKQLWIEWVGAEKVWEIYGGTERYGFTTINGREWLQRRGSVGRPRVGRMKVLRADGSECMPGESGEIYFLADGGPGSTYHYIGAESKRVAEGWESYGDMGWLDADGYLYIADRRVDLILRAGANIYPAEVEAALDAHPAIASSAVIGLPHAELGRVVHALVQPRAGVPLDLPEIQAFLSQRLVRYKLPESYEISPVPLRDDAGKVRRIALVAEREAWLEQGREFRLRA